MQHVLKSLIQLIFRVISLPGRYLSTLTRRGSKRSPSIENPPVKLTTPAKSRNSIKRYFTYKDDKSDKFWSIEVQNTSTVVNYGKTGTAGIVVTKAFESEAYAQKEADHLIHEKLRKGYVEHRDETAGSLTASGFWNLIERAKSKAQDTEEQVEVLTELLSTRTEADIIAFQKIFEEVYAQSYRSDLWAAAYIINGGCSDDGFDYFRGWLIAQGREVFENTLKNPEYLARVINSEEAGAIECESVLYAAGNAYANKTGLAYEAFLALTPRKPYPNINLDWDEEGDELANRFPKLWKKFM